MPLAHPPGHARCDFGQARAVIGGVEQVIHYLVLDLPQGDGCYVKAYPAETTEAFREGPVSAFSFLGEVPRSIVYDNTKLAVVRIMGDGRRQRTHRRTRVFAEMQSHHLFEDRFGRPGKGNDKDKVEGLVGYARRNFLAIDTCRSDVHDGYGNRRGDAFVVTLSAYQGIEATLGAASIASAPLPCAPQFAPIPVRSGIPAY